MSGILYDATTPANRHGSFLSAADLKPPANPVLDSADDLPADEPSDDVLDSAAENFGAAVERSQAMGIALTFIEEGDYTFDSVDSLMRGVVGIDAEGEQDPTEDEERDYNDLSQAVMDSLVSLGGDPDQVKSFLQDEDDIQGEALGGFLATAMDENVLDDSTIINRHAVSDNVAEAGDDGVLDAAKVKKIRNGRVVWVPKKRIGPKKRMSAKQKAALKKARMKSNSSAAKAKRAKSSRMAEKLGL